MLLPDRPTPLINWHWLEDLLVRACEAEVRVFGERHRDERFFAFCLGFDGIDGSTHLSYGTREAVERRVAEKREAGETDSYRAVELEAENWKYRCQAIGDPEGYFRQAQSVVEQYAELMRDDREPDEAEFYWLRFEYLTECAVRRLIDRDAFRPLRHAEEFIAYSHCEEERLEELEDRLEKLYPAYRRATMEWWQQPRPGDFTASRCAAPSCRRTRDLARCTWCQDWFCPGCASHHAHPELAEPQSFFL